MQRDWLSKQPTVPKTGACEERRHPHLLPYNASKGCGHGRELASRSVGDLLDDVSVYLCLVLGCLVNILSQLHHLQGILLIVRPGHPA